MAKYLVEHRIVIDAAGRRRMHYGITFNDEWLGVRKSRLSAISALTVRKVDPVEARVAVNEAIRGSF